MPDNTNPLHTSEIQLITTDDGSHSLYNPLLNETYHSKHGALQEAKHVYIEMGVDYFPQTQEIHIFEFGMGTGLNLMWTLAEHLKNPSRKIVYQTVEIAPVSPELVQQLNYASMFPAPEMADLFKTIHTVAWGETVNLLANFEFKKFHAHFNEVPLADGFYDVIYFDAFAPNKQPDVWTTDIFKKLFSICKTGAVLVTYCAQGQFRRDLASVGFDVKKVKGPLFKKEMIRAHKV